MSTATAKISSKGQLTVPAAMRRKLGADVVTLRMVGQTITVEPQKSLAGALSAYAKGVPDLKKEREVAWELEVKERHERWMRD